MRTPPPLDVSGFCGFPQPTPLQTYEDASQYLIRHWTSLPQKPIAIYQIGSIAAPGISDLDYVLVFRDKSRIDWKHYLPNRFPVWIQNLFTHHPFFATPSTWFDLKGWYPTFNKRLLWGEDLPIREPGPELLPGLALGMLVDYIICKIPSDLLSIGLSPHPNIRILLCLLHSVRYIFDLARAADIPPPPSASDWVRSMDMLRSNWFSLSPAGQTQELTSIWDRFGPIILDQINEIDLHLIKHINPSPKGCHGSIDSMFWFTEDKTAYRINSAVQHKRNDGSIPFPLPNSFMHVLSVYSDTSPFFRDHFHRHKIECTTCEYEGHWSKGLRYHAKSMIENRISTKLMGVPSQKYIALGTLPLPFHRRAIAYLGRITQGQQSLTNLLVDLKRHLIHS